MSDKVYIGSGKVIKTKYGDLTKVSFSESDIKKMQENLSKGWINLVLKEKRNKVEGKPTHYLELDRWKPENSTSEIIDGNAIKSDDLPF